MVKVTIVNPNNTPEQEKEVLKNIAYAIKKIVEAKFEVNANVEILKK